jgi:hypothetical protein
MGLVAQGWIWYGVRVAVVWSDDRVSLGKVVGLTDSSVFVEVDGDRVRFRPHSLTMFGGDARIERPNAMLVRLADQQRAIRTEARAVRARAADSRLQRGKNITDAIEALIELRDEATRSIAYLSTLDPS